MLRTTLRIPRYFPVRVFIFLAEPLSSAASMDWSLDINACFSALSAASTVCTRAVLMDVRKVSMDSDRAEFGTADRAELGTDDLAELGAADELADRAEFRRSVCGPAPAPFASALLDNTFSAASFSMSSQIAAFFASQAPTLADKMGNERKGEEKWPWKNVLLKRPPRAKCNTWQ